MTVSKKYSNAKLAVSCPELMVPVPATLESRDGLHQPDINRLESNLDVRGASSSDGSRCLGCRQLGLSPALLYKIATVSATADSEIG